MKLPVHRWFRYSAGFSAQWVESVIETAKSRGGRVAVVDPFAGSGTTLICAEQCGVEALGIEAHPFVARVALAKLLYTVEPGAFLARVRKVAAQARSIEGSVKNYPHLIRKCFSDEALASLDALKIAVLDQGVTDDFAELTWLCLVSSLRSVSHVGTAPWQYVLPNKSKRKTQGAAEAFSMTAQTMARDMVSLRRPTLRARLFHSDARACVGIPDGFATLVVTSPPYANNYDYADATRLEMTFLGEIEGWADLQDRVRRHLMRSCSQHVPERSAELDTILSDPELEPIRAELSDACGRLSSVRMEKGGKKTYHLMAACYFADMAQVWRALRRICAPEAEVCFVIGDSAPYGVHLPVIEWTGALAVKAGFKSWRFDKLRDRNVKWKNRKHRVPLVEGRLWVRG